MSAAPAERDSEQVTAESGRQDAAGESGAGEEAQRAGEGGRAEDRAEHDHGEGERAAEGEHGDHSSDGADGDRGSVQAPDEGEHRSDDDEGERRSDNDEGDRESGEDGRAAARERGGEEEEEEEEDTAGFKLSRLGLGELIAVSGSALLVLCLWLPWFSTNLANPNSSIDRHRGHVIAWDSFHYLPWILIVLALPAPILAYIVVRGHELSYNRGEITTLAGIIAFIFVICNGILFGKPGGNPVEVGLYWGWGAALVASLAITAGGIIRQSENPPDPEPPGV